VLASQRTLGQPEPIPRLNDAGFRPQTCGVQAARSSAR